MKKYYTGLVVTILIATAFALTAMAQVSRKTADPKLAADTRMNPHDFLDGYYGINGVIGNMIIDRRTGKDFLSVFSWSSDPNHSNIRVTVTLPAYGPNGETRFWYPLGEINDEGFTPDRIGGYAREMANVYPIYVFPRTMHHIRFSFTNNRQAALIDDSRDRQYGYKANPLGIRIIVKVDYTEKAFIRAGYELMNYMARKNGLSLDGTPLIKSMDDLIVLKNEGLVALDPIGFADPRSFGGLFAISPTIDDPTNGVIAKDAFLLTVLDDNSKPLTGELMFADQFKCLQNFGNWCGAKE
jgi:hypothetical protein